jgi:hypothetical protein
MPHVNFLTETLVLTYFHNSRLALCVKVALILLWLKKRYKIHLHKFMNDKSNNFHVPKV